MTNEEARNIPRSQDDSAGRVVLSICLPTFNRARYVECLLQDLAEHLPRLGFSYELLIGDNASTDQTAQVVRRYQSFLNIRYFKREKNMGAYGNLHQLHADAAGEYLIYLADDDLLVIDVLRESIAAMERAPDLGAVFAPWLIHDRIARQDVGQFYSVDQDVRIEQGCHGALFALLVNKHIFPEIYIIRTSLAKSLSIPESPFAFGYFVRVAAMVDRAAVMFAKKPFYRSVSRYFEDENRAQAGIEQVKDGWDCYRGGLEYIYAKFSGQLSDENRQLCRRGIDRFIDLRMQVGLRIRTEQSENWIDNYYIANRLLANGGPGLLPTSYDFYRVNAAMAFLLQLKPFAPVATRFTYYDDDPPIVLSMAQNFTKEDFLVLSNRQVEVPPNSVVLTTRKPFKTQDGVLSISEPELLSRFP